MAVFALVLAIIIAAVVSVLWWDARGKPRTPVARALAATAGVVACVWMAWLLVDEAKDANLVAPRTVDLAIAAALPSTLFVASVLASSRISWRGLGWLGFVLPLPAGVVMWIMASDGASDALGALAWASVAWTAAATPSALRSAKTLWPRVAAGFGIAPLVVITAWALLLFPVALLTGFTDDFETPPATISFQVEVSQSGGPYAVRVAWPNSTLDGPAWQALQAGIADEGGAWEADGKAVWFNGTGDQAWQVRLLGYAYYDDASSLVALGPTHVTSTSEVRVAFGVHLRPGGCYESLTAESTVAADAAATLSPDIERGCV